MSPFRHLRLIAFAILVVFAQPFRAVAASTPSPAPPVTVGFLSDEASRDLAELLRQRLQTEPRIVFLERIQLADLGREIALHDRLAQIHWEGCELLVRLEVFSTAANRDRQLIVRIIAPRSLQTLGLWVYPFNSADPDGLASRLAPRLLDTLSTSARAPTRAVSLSLLRGDTPTLNAIAESATYALAARLHELPGVSLLERWNIRDPAFEQWLLQSTPADLRPPDLRIEGAVTETDGGLALRLSINDTLRVFNPAPTAAPAPADQSVSGALSLAALSAARSLAEDTPAPRDPALKNADQLRFAADARWFWKWRAFDRAASAAETAVYLGAQDLETLHIRALSYLGLPKTYVSNLPFAQTPDDAALQNTLRGLEHFNAIPPPPLSADWRDRWRHLHYSAHALNCAGSLLQGLYFSDRPMPGFPEDIRRLRTLSRTLALKTISYAGQPHRFPQSYTNILEHIPAAIGETWFQPLITYAGLWTDDPAELAEQYTRAFAACARAGNGPDVSAPFSVFYPRCISPHYPWIAAWGGPAPDEANVARLVSTLTSSPDPAIRLTACFMFLGRTPPGLPPKIAKIRAICLRWAFDALGREPRFFSTEPTKYSFQFLSFLGGEVRRLREDNPADFPEAEWRAALNRLAAVTRSNPNSEYPGQIARLLTAFIGESRKNALAPTAALPPNTDEEVVAALRVFLVAPPTLSSAERVALTKVARGRSPSPPHTDESVGKTTVTRESTSFPLADSTPPRSEDGRLAPVRLFPGQIWGQALSANYAEDGATWFFFQDFRSRTLRFVETDPAFQRAKRVILVQNLPGAFGNARPDHFVVRGQHLYLVDRDALHALSLTDLSLRSYPLPRLAEPCIWRAGASLWIAGGPGIILEFNPADQRLRLVASSMRTPATNSLDARAAYQVTRIFEHEGITYAWLNNQQLYRLAPGGPDTRPLYSTQVHRQPGGAYPVDLLLKGIGISAPRYSYENILDTLILDPRLGGTLAVDTLSQPVLARLPDGTEARTNEVRSAAAAPDHLWLLYRSTRQGLTLGSFARGTGAAAAYPLNFPSRIDPDRIYRVPTGILFSCADSIWFLLPDTTFPSFSSLEAR